MITFPSTLAFKIVAAAGALLLLALLVHDRNRWKSKTAHYADLLAGERAAHGATVANYRAAAEQARREDSENIARVKAAQEAINERTGNDFESRIAAARARADELRQRATRTTADPRPGGTAPVSGLSASAGETSQAASQNRLPDADALIATEQAIQLDELIKWVCAQGKVEPDRR